MPSVGLCKYRLTMVHYKSLVGHSNYNMHHNQMTFLRKEAISRDIKISQCIIVLNLEYSICISVIWLCLLGLSNLYFNNSESKCTKTGYECNLHLKTFDFLTTTFYVACRWFVDCIEIKQIKFPPSSNEDKKVLLNSISFSSCFYLIAYWCQIFPFDLFGMNLNTFQLEIISVSIYLIQIIFFV